MVLHIPYRHFAAQNNEQRRIKKGSNFHINFLMISYLKQFLIMVLIIFGQNGFSLDTDTINSSLVLNDSDTINSSGNRFVLGFFSPNGTTNRYVGVWYSVSPQIIVWIANRDNPLNDSSGTVSLSSDGNIVVMSGQQQIIWAASKLSFSTSNTTARLMDSGNLVLQDTLTGSTVWESFAHPTDTFLPNMRQSHNPRTGVKVVSNSWRTLQDPSHGNFTSGLDAIGVPQVFIWTSNGTVPRWRSGPWNGIVFAGVTRPYSIYLDGFTLTTEQDGTVYITWGEVQNLNRIPLNATGFLSNAIWNVQRKEWVVTWTAPANDCDLYNFCGPFAQCYIKDSPICSCLKGYEPSNIEEWRMGIWRGGCVRRVKFRCEKNGTRRGKEDGFLELTYIKVPDFEQRTAGLETECKGMCLRNCSCLAYSYDSAIGCMFWNETLIDVQKFPDGANAGTNFYLRVPYSELDKKNHSIVIISSAIGSLITAFVCLAGAWWICKRKGKCLNSENETGEKYLLELRESAVKIDKDKISIEELPLFSFKTLADATNNFDMTNKLGLGGFGPVFKGKLTDNREIAVKRLSAVSGQGFEEFMNEVVVISKLQHRNLVQLLGCCVEKEEKILVYEYVKNRSLDVFLFDRTQNVLDWKKRFNIIEGIGRGLLYLHRDSRLKIIHRDLKPSNVLLDEEWNPKISDFGMARIFGGTEDQAKTRKVVGTHGYMAPEYVIGGRFSEKSDVFSFGVIILEIISGRKNTSFYNDELSLSLLGHAWKLWHENNAVDLIDKRISDPSSWREILRCTQIGLLCVQEFHGNRPTMSTVLSMLSSEIIDLPTPGHPGFTESGHFGSSSQSTQSGNRITITMLEGR